MEQKVRYCTACRASGKSLEYQIPKKQFGKIKTLTEPGQELQIDFTGKLYNKNLNGEVLILIAFDRFSRWSTARIYKTSVAKEVTNFLTSNFSLYRRPEKIKSEKWAFISKENKEFWKHRNIETSKSNTVLSECIPETG